mmetsp:Transcript_14461/g.31109  ORF Transcript_14461/g.31109 Transcript_14461/m.31109 type:complete len:150 (-) Transcript_14461:17-466(-)
MSTRKSLDMIRGRDEQRPRSKARRLSMFLARVKPRVTASGSRVDLGSRERASNSKMSSEKQNSAISESLEIEDIQSGDMTVDMDSIEILSPVFEQEPQMSGNDRMVRGDSRIFKPFELSTDEKPLNNQPPAIAAQSRFDALGSARFDSD